jgi:hypothetical protein
MQVKKKPLDAGTAELVKKLLSLPPKQHEDMKVGRPASQKKRKPTGRASSAKRHTD